MRVSIGLLLLLSSLPIFSGCADHPAAPPQDSPAPYALAGSWGSPDGTDGFSPASIALGTTGDLFVIDRDHHRILKVDPEGRLLAVWRGDENGGGRFHAPVAVDGDGEGRIVVLDFGYEFGVRRIQVFDESGGFLEELPDGLYPPTDIATRQGAVFLPDPRGEIRRVDRDGAGAGFPTPDFPGIGAVTPMSLDVSPSGEIVVAGRAGASTEDSGSQVVQIYDASGALHEQWNVPEEDGLVFFPDAAAGPSGRVFLPDPGRGRVLVYEPDGTLLGDIEEGLELPYGVVVGASGEIYVGDTRLGRVFRFEPTD